MDSKLIYNATIHLGTLITWEDWIYFGRESEINVVQIEKFIDIHLKSNEVLFVSGRNNSGEYKGDKIIEVINPILGKEDFKLWNISMEKVIEFSKIGVLRFGSIK